MDIISFNEAATANGRIEKFIENPDSNSGIVTVPKVIGAGESVTIPAGRMAVLPNVQVDGTINIEGEVFIPSGSTIDMSNGLAINGEKVVMSVPTSYHLLQGNLAVDNTVITQGFNTTLYTGNGSTQSINTGINMDTQWGDTTEEKFGGLVWIKGRNNPTSHILIDTVRGSIKEIFTESTSAEQSQPTGITSFNPNGFSLGSMLQANGNAATYTSWNFQTTHRISGTTNHGKPYTCHYNPYTGFTIVKYEGSGIAGHEIPHHLGRKLDFHLIKNLINNSTVGNWDGGYTQNKTRLILNVTASGVENNLQSVPVDNVVTLSNNGGVNDATNSCTYIMYGWSNSYFDESSKLIGNYEIGVYQGTGVAGNKVKTRGKPAWLMIKRLDSTGNWNIANNMMAGNGLWPNLPAAQGGGWNHIYYPDGFSPFNDPETNTSGGQYLYMVAYDTNSDGGGSYYPKASDTSNVQINNALIPISKGSDINGLKNVMLSKNEVITGLTYTAGKNYIYYDGNGNKGVKSVAPSYGTVLPNTSCDFYHILKNKWYEVITDPGDIISDGSTNTSTTKVTPNMTSNNQDGFILSSSTEYSASYNANKAFDGLDDSRWWETSGASSGWLQVQLPSAKIINKYLISPPQGYVNKAPKAWTIQASNTGAFAGEQVTLDSKSDVTGWVSSNYKTFSFINSTPYLYYRIVVTSTGGGQLGIGELQYIEAQISSNPIANEIPEGRNYLNHIVHADNDGGVLYVEELPKIEYKDIIKANEYQGKNACTAWAIIDGQTTPPKIRDSYGISSVIKTTTGKYELIPTEDFNNEFFSVTGTSGIPTAEFKHLELQTKNRIKVQIWSGSSYVDAIFSVQIFGGKN